MLGGRRLSRRDVQLPAKRWVIRARCFCEDFSAQAAGRVKYGPRSSTARAASGRRFAHLHWNVGGRRLSRRNMQLPAKRWVMPVGFKNFWDGTKDWRVAGQRVGSL